MLAALLIGIGRGASAPISGAPEQLQALAGSSAIVVSGIVDDYPESRGALTQFRFSVQRHRADGGWVEASGLLLVRAKPSIPMIEERSPPFFRYGDTLVLKGIIEQPPVLEEFDWREYLAREGVHYLMLRPEVELTGAEGGMRALGWVYRVREEMAASLGRSLPEPRGLSGTGTTARHTGRASLGAQGGLCQDRHHSSASHLGAACEHSGGAGKSRQCRSAGKKGTDLHRYTPAFRMGVRRAHRFLAAGGPSGHYGKPLPVGHIPGPPAKRLDCSFCSRCAYGRG